MKKVAPHKIIHTSYHLVSVGPSTDLLLQNIEVIDDDRDEEVEGEEGSKHDEDNKVEVSVQVGFKPWLLILLPQTDKLMFMSVSTVKLWNVRS